MNFDLKIESINFLLYLFITHETQYTQCAKMLSLLNSSLIFLLNANLCFCSFPFATSTSCWIARITSQFRAVCLVYKTIEFNKSNTILDHNKNVFEFFLPELAALNWASEGSTTKTLKVIDHIFRLQFFYSLSLRNHVCTHYLNKL